MIQINKVGNAIVIKFTDNDKYLFNGTIEVAPNELMVVVDQSNMVTFKKMSNGDTLFGQSYEKIRINDEPVTKENIVEKFATIGFTSGGGGAVDSVNGQTGTVIITASSIGAITKETADATYQPIGDYAVKSDLSTLATKTELNAKLDTSVYEVDKATFALKSELSDLVTTEQLNTKQDILVSGTNIKTINGQSLLGKGNIEIQGGELPIASADTLGGIKVGAGLSINPETGVLSATGGGTADSVEWDNVLSKPDDIVNITERLAAKLDTATYNSEKANFATKEELNSKADTSAIADMATQTWVTSQGYLTEIPSEYVTDSELTEALAGKADSSALAGKQDTLVSGTNIKTVNGNSLLGEGDITIQGGGVGQSYYVEETLKGEIFNDYESNTASGLYSHSEGYKTIASSGGSHAEGGNTTASGSYAHAEGNGTIARGENAHSEGYQTTASGNHSHAEGYQTKATQAASHTEGAYTLVSNTYEHAQGNYNKSNTGDTDDKKTRHSIGIGTSKDDRKNAQEVMTNGDHYIIGIGGYDGTNPEAAQTLQEVVNSGSITVDTEMSDTSTNAVQNKVIKAYIDSLVGNILTQLQEINGTN